MPKFLLKILSLILHIPAIGIIYYFWQPIANWYLSKIPALGVDLYLSATHVSYQLRNFSLPFNSFKDFWFGGYPLIRDFNLLAYYLMMPFAAMFGAVIGVQKFTMFALLFIIVCCYLLFYKLSKNHGLALLLAILVLLSPNIYGAAVWAGSIPYFSSQALFPLGLFAGALYLTKSSARYLALMILITGIGFLVHPLGILTFLIPSLWTIIIASGVYAKYSTLRIIKNFILYNLGWLLAAFTATHDYLITILTQRVLPPGIVPKGTSNGGDVSETASAIAQFYRDQVALLYTQTNPWLFKVLVAGLVLFASVFLFSKQKRRVIIIIPFIFIVFWSALHPAVNLGGIINFFRHDPYRAFWQFPIVIGALAAALWGYFLSTISDWLKRGVYLKTASFMAAFVIAAGFAGFAYFIFLNQIDKTIETIEVKSELSSAFPEALSINFKKNDLERLKKQLLPSFINPNDKNKRLYEADATVNIWWNSFFDVPLARGYIDPPIGTQNRGGFFWLDIAIANDSLTRDFGVSEEVALNNALFLIDWYAVGYFEGGRLSSKGPSVPPSSYLLNNNVFDKDELITTYGAVLKYQTASGRPELIPDLPQNLNFYKVADRFTSPILYPTNASTIAIFSTDSGYEDILRILAFANLNSKKLIPVRAGESIDELSLDQLKSFDAIFLHEYKYHNQKKAFDRLEKYVREGGKVFIDTGAETKESQSDQLPEIMPFGVSERRGRGKDWDFSVGTNEIIKDIDFSQFGPLIFNELDWKLSTPSDGTNLRNNSTVLLSHQGEPVLIERNLGKGKVLWSGMNLAYHYNQYKSDEEARLFLNILDQFVDLNEKQLLNATAQWIKPEKVVIETSEKPRGILFKEQGYDGWSARDASGKKLPIFLAGPTFPGFMYVPLADSKDASSVSFLYNGTFTFWAISAINLLFILFLIDAIVLKGLLFGRLVTVFTSKIRARVSNWWDREEE